MVTSIIALFASVVLSSLSEARSKARDAKRYAEAEQIRKAISSYIAEKGEFPAHNGTWTCFGLNDNERCYGSAFTGNTQLKNAMDKYFKEYPSYGIPNYGNILYRFDAGEKIGYVTLATEDMSSAKCLSIGGIWRPGYNISVTSLKACDIPVK